jgi:leucyl/phenylalanyl-tRNA--protein transferase
LRRRLNKQDVRVSLDEAFSDVMAACAEPREELGGTWLIPAMQAAYRAMHEAGLAHSVEVWRGDRLIGALYGVALGRMFFGESMMSRERDGSKIALAWLAAQMLDWKMPLIDCQMATEHLASLGARTILRRQFIEVVAALVTEPGPPAWRFDPALDPVSRLARASPVPPSVDR